MGFVRGAVLIALIVLPVGAWAQSATSNARANLLSSQLNVLDNRAASQYSGSIRLAPPRAVVPGTPEARAMMANVFDSPYQAPARKAARDHGVPEDLFLRLVQQESGWNPRAVSPKGAMGLAQLMPQTAAFLRVDANSPSENLTGGARYLRLMYDKFGSWRLALAAYNAGPEAVEKYHGIPPYKETQNYVRIILGS